MGGLTGGKKKMVMMLLEGFVDGGADRWIRGSALVGPTLDRTGLWERGHFVLL